MSLSTVLGDAVSKSAFVALYPSDFLADIGHLGNTELGVYTRLLLVYYRDGRPLPFDTDRLRRIAMTVSPEEMKALNDVLAEFFVLSAEPDGTRVWRHKRADKEIAAAQAARDKRVAQTAAARRVRHKASESSVTESVTELVTGSVTGGEPESESEPEKRTTHTPARACETPAALAVVLRKAGVQCTGSHPTLIEMAAQGVSVDTLMAAVAEAKRATGGSFNVKYLAAIVSRWASEAKGMNFSGAAPPQRGQPSALEKQADVVARMTGGLMGRTQPDPRTIDVDSDEPERPRLAAGSR